MLLLGPLRARGAAEPPLDPDASAILVSRRGLRVPLGRSVWLDPAADLVLRVRPGDRCAVAAVGSGPGPQRAGALDPPRFPCAFARGRVTYTHFGARSPGRYRLRLQLRYDSPRRTLVVPFTLEVEVLFQQLRLLSRHLPLPVEELRGLSAPLDGKVLAFPEGAPGRRCRLTLLPPEAAGPLPASGRLLDAEGRPLPAGYSGDCSAVLRAGIRYQHTAATASPGRDRIPARVSAGPGQREYFQVLVRIREGADNTPPKPSFLALLMLEVEQFALTALTPDVLAAEDLETPPDLLIFNLISAWPSDPRRQGFLLSTDDPGRPLGAFSQQEVRELKIAYQPPTLDSDQDSVGNSLQGTFTLFLQPVDNQPPQITNTGFTVLEGNSFLLTSHQLDATDEDTSADQIVFTVTQAPEHGHLHYLEEGLIVQGESFLLDDIAGGRISYKHSGDEFASDSYQLEVSDGVHHVPITVKVAVQSVDDENPSIALPGGHRRVGAAIDVLENGATEITISLIQGIDEDTDDLVLTFIVQDPPKLGDILVDGVQSEKFTQHDLIGRTVTYAHTSGEIGLKKRYDSFNLTISDLSSERVVGVSAVQRVCVAVTILPVDSIAPEVMVAAEPLSVLEGGKSTLTLDQLDAEDVDTPRDDILCVVTAQSTSGYLENVSPAPGSEKSRAGSAISAFSIKDVRLGHVNYVQSIHKGVEPVEDRFTFQCSDGVNFSPHHFFPIVIVPTNDEKPELFVHEFVVLEGMSLVIDTPILNGADADMPPDELRFVIAVPPKHGQIVQQLSTGTVPVHSFTSEEIRETSSILYEHDDSETKEDSFQIQLTDGYHTVEQNVPIMVVLVDDETPRMAINNGLEVEIGKSKVISSQDLKATDIDSEDKSLVYVIRLAPVQGFLQHLNRQDEVLCNITQGTNFTQDDLDQGLIRYVHTGLHGVRDLIKFDVTDGINALIDRYFYITIGSIDMVFLEVINKGVTLKEGGKVTLTTDLLSTSDVNSPDENLCFSVTRSPIWGHLENSDSPGVPVVSFTQLQLAGNKIYYIHTAEDEVKTDSFEFQVTDGYNPVFRTFRVSITDVDNKKPILTIGDLLVEEGETRLITPFELTVEDGDTPDHLLLFTVTQIPVHGQILYNNSYPVTSFTKQDLSENLISYRHDGTETSQDSFSFIHQLPVGHLGFLITSKVLKAEDRDSPQKLLKYKITDGPQHGFIINTGLGNGSIGTFMQGWC
uniref:FRAS1 related extracellular matrix 3 n=1 Tax=Otus sunia TaxID=257818 RepID=A0A8C8EFL5_9STRI